MARFIIERASEAFRRKPFKPSTTFKDDPVPAVNPQQLKGEYKYRPGHYAPDPVPAQSANSVEMPAFKPLHVECDGSFAGPDPIPAATYWDDF